MCGANDAATVVWQDQRAYQVPDRDGAGAVSTMYAAAQNDHYDALVIGSGPGGATTAARAAESGKRVLLLERGDFLPRERDNWNSEAVFGDAKYTADETFYDL